MTYVIDPLAIATEGILASQQDSAPALRIVVLGWLVTVVESIITPPAVGGGFGGPRGVGGRPKKKKRFTATVTINGIEYTETVEVEDLSLTVKDVSVNIIDAQTAPKLTISVKGHK
jgi:hypothetical protein